MNCVAIKMEPFGLCLLCSKVPFEKWVVMSLIPQGSSRIHPLWVDLWRAGKPQVPQGSLSSSFLLSVFIPSPSLPPLLYPALLGVKKANLGGTVSPSGWHQGTESQLLKQLSCSEVLWVQISGLFLQECDPLARG